MKKGKRGMRKFNRYKLEVEVYYPKANSIFGFFDREYARLIGMLVDHMRKVMVEVCIVFYIR